MHLDLRAGASTGVVCDYTERAVYVASGRISVDGQAFDAGQMIVFAAGDAATIKAVESATVMLLGGEPVGPRHIWWNFVSSSRERIEQAKADWKDGRFALPKDDDREFIPLPEDPPPPPEPM